MIGAIWTIGTSTGSRAFSLVASILITHFLTPDICGELSLASVTVLTATVITNCGISQYIVSRPKDGRDAVFHATFYYLLLGAISMGIVVLLRGRIAAWMNAEIVAIYIPYLAISSMMDRVTTIQDRILVRDMRFQAVGLQRSLGEITFAVVSVVLAWRGWGGHAILWASLARSVLLLIARSITTPRREWLEPCRITWQRTREFFAFGLPMSIAGIAGFGARKWDNAIVFRRFGDETAGIYNYAYQIADIPASQVGETIGDVLVPSFDKMESNEKRKNALMISMRLMILIIAPMAVGLGVIAPTLVRTFFTQRWWSMDGMLTILAVLSVVRPIGWIGSSYLQVRNMPRTIMLLEVTKTLSLGALMLAFQNLYRLMNFVGLPQVSASLGFESRASLWSCVSVGVAFALNSLGFMWVIRRIDQISLRAQILPLLPPLLACIPMVPAVLGIRHLLDGLILPNGLRVTAEMLGGALVFIPSALLIAPSTSQHFIKLLQHALLRRRARGSLNPAPPPDGLVPPTGLPGEIDAPGSAPKPPIV